MLGIGLGRGGVASSDAKPLRCASSAGLVRARVRVRVRVRDKVRAPRARARARARVRARDSDKVRAPNPSLWPQRSTTSG